MIRLLRLESSAHFQWGEMKSNQNTVQRTKSTFCKVGAAIKVRAATKAPPPLRGGLEYLPTTQKFGRWGKHPVRRGPPATRGKMSEARGKKFSNLTKSEKRTLASCLLLLASRGTGGGSEPSGEDPGGEDSSICPLHKSSIGGGNKKNLTLWACGCIITLCSYSC